MTSFYRKSLAETIDEVKRQKGKTKSIRDFRKLNNYVPKIPSQKRFSVVDEILEKLNQENFIRIECEEPKKYRLALCKKFKLQGVDLQTTTGDGCVYIYKRKVYQ